MNSPLHLYWTMLIQSIYFLEKLKIATLKFIFYYQVAYPILLYSMSSCQSIIGFIPITCEMYPCVVISLTVVWGVQWLSGRVLDWRPKGHGFEPHQHHCGVSLSKNINPSLVLVQPRKTHPFITERLLMGHKESNQTVKLIVVL